MSIYNVLSIDAPIIGYSILHQAKKGVKSREYSKTVLGLHRDIAEESIKIQEIWRNYLNGSREKAIQTTRGSLSQFLSTPLHSDMNEIERIIGDQIQQIALQVLDPDAYGIVDSLEHKITFEKISNFRNANLLNEGRKILRKLGFNVGTSLSNIHESVFIVKGGQNLDLLEYIIRDRISIYNGSHGKHVGQLQNNVFSVANIILIDGEFQQKGKFELSFCFSKRKGTYKELHQAIRETTGKDLKGHKGITQISLWQRKLGLSNLPEFTLRIYSKDKASLKDSFNDILKKIGAKKSIASMVQPIGVFLKELVV